MLLDYLQIKRQRVKGIPQRYLDWAGPKRVRIPLEIVQNLKQLSDKTVRVFVSVAALIRGGSQQLKIAEIADLALLKDRQTREHLKRLEKLGLIGSKKSNRGKWYWIQYGF